MFKNVRHDCLEKQADARPHMQTHNNQNTGATGVRECPRIFHFSAFGNLTVCWCGESGPISWCGESGPISWCGESHPISWFGESGFTSWCGESGPTSHARTGNSWTNRVDMSIKLIHVRACVCFCLVKQRVFRLSSEATIFAQICAT